MLCNEKTIGLRMGCKRVGFRSGSYFTWIRIREGYCPSKSESDYVRNRRIRIQSIPDKKLGFGIGSLDSTSMEDEKKKEWIGN